MGRQIQEYKKYLAKISGNTHDYNAEKLCPHPPLQEPGTPDDNHSVLSFFGGNRNRSSNTSSGTNKGDNRIAKDIGFYTIVLPYTSSPPTLHKCQCKGILDLAWVDVLF
jgi:hypothetical protein